LLALAVAALLGCGWNLIAVLLLGGRPADALRPSWLAAGLIAGAAAGWFTLHSRERNEGRETLRDGLLTYLLGIVVYWAAFVVLERARLCIAHGGWTAFNLVDHGRLLLWLVYGAVLYGIVLIPLAFLTRSVVWKTRERSASLSKA
jgi:hypothetical protein